ncbi:MAG: hypothetical protein JWM36_686 [Hyphomicrobiales bacterium]|nr:hypothetical protein [Hyphomicrobiales bacterium]
MKHSANSIFAAGTAEGLTASAIHAVIATGSAFLVELRQRAADTRRAAIDPSLTGEFVAKALKSASELDFEAIRTEEAIARLQERASEREAIERADRNHAAFEDARRLRDAAVEAVRSYPNLASKIVTALGQLQEADRAVKAANASIPDGEERLEFAEAIARGVPIYKAEIEGLAATVRLTGFGADGTFRPLWPLRVGMMD